jgi:gas vesicle protein
MDTDRILSFVIGLLSGGLVGAAAVILYAPQSGRDLRQGVANKYQEIIQSGRRAMMEQRQALQDEYKARIQIPLHSAEE